MRTCDTGLPDFLKHSNNSPELLLPPLEAGQSNRLNHLEPKNTNREISKQFLIGQRTKGVNLTAERTTDSGVVSTLATTQ